MKDDQLGFVVGVILGFMLSFIVVRVLELDAVFEGEVLEATYKCKEGTFIKVDQTHIYCKDGAKYKLED